MIREQSRFAINPLYIVAVAMCCICSICTTLYQALLFGLITVVVALLCINIVSFVEKIADKNLRAFLITMLAAMLIVVIEYVFELMNKEFLLANAQNLKWIVLAVVTLSIVPTYFETRLATKHYFANMFYSIFAFLIMIIVYGTIIEFAAYGSLAGYRIFANFSGFAVASQLFFQLFVIGIMVIIANYIYNLMEDRKMRYNLLVERYKAQIKQVLITTAKQKENKYD